MRKREEIRKVVDYILEMQKYKIMANQDLIEALVEMMIAIDKVKEEVRNGTSDNRRGTGKDS